jgi:carnitine O-acetyltransferase
MYLSSLSTLLHAVLLPLSVAALAVDTHIQGRTQITPDGNKIGSPLPQNLRIEQKRAHRHSPAPPSKHFRRWPEPLIEAHGDYRDEEFLEQHIGGPLYSKQNELPRLPVPSLKETINRLLPTAMPLALDEEEKQKFIDACQLFPKEAKDLQYRLSERRKEYDSSSWLQQLWNTNGYLQVRDPVAVKVSYFLFVPDDNTLPHACQKGIARGAAMIVAMAQSRKLVCSGQMPYETIQHRGEDEILCSTGFKYSFHGCRIPRREQDAYHIYDPSQHKHCVVACGGQFFALQFVDEMDDPLPLKSIEEQLKNCVKLAKSANSSLPELGWLTSTGRDFWADAREELLQVGGTQMKEALSTLESGAFVLNLDDEVSKKCFLFVSRQIRQISLC